MHRWILLYLTSLLLPAGFFVQNASADEELIEQSAIFLRAGTLEGAKLFLQRLSPAVEANDPKAIAISDQVKSAFRAEASLEQAVAQREELLEKADRAQKSAALVAKGSSLTGEVNERALERYKIQAGQLSAEADQVVHVAKSRVATQLEILYAAASDLIEAGDETIGDSLQTMLEKIAARWSLREDGYLETPKRTG